MLAEERRPSPASSLLPAHEIWWSLLLAQIARARAAIPAELSGVVEIAIEREDDDPAYFHILVRGPRTEGFRGPVARSDVRVGSSERELSALLTEAEPPRGALRASGDARLFRALLTAIAGAPKPRSMLALRGGR